MALLFLVSLNRLYSFKCEGDLVILNLNKMDMSFIQKKISNTHKFKMSHLILSLNFHFMEKNAHWKSIL